MLSASFLLLSLTAALAASAASAAPRRSYATVPGHPCIRSLEGTADAMSDLAEAHPSLASVITIGDSYLRENPGGAEANEAFPAGGYALKALVLTNGDAATASADKARVLVVAGHHPRELGPPELVLRFAERLLAGHGADAETTALLDRTEISLVFHANPDGRHVAEARRDLMWRKNANGGEHSSCGSSRLGVDLNRNYDFFWGDTSGGRASDDPCKSNYAGRRAFSEPESRAVRGLARRLFPRAQRRDDPEGSVDVPVGEDNTGVFVDVHSSGGYVFYPWGYEDSKSPDNDSLESLARKMASFNGYKLWAGGQPDFQYPVSGDASDYMYAAMGVASFGYEIGKAFYEDCDLFERKIAPDNIPSLMYVSRTARRPFRIAKGPDVLAFEVAEAGNANADEETGEATAMLLDVSVTASDDELLNSDFKTGRQGVEAVRLSVDVHPDDEGGAMMEMEPVGGTNNNSGRRSFELQVSTDGMAPGRHTMYSVAVDGAGYEGPVSAVFFDVPVRAAVETDQPTTSAPQTAEPTTAAPVSGAPTAAPITDSPTTAAPISDSPTAAAAVTPATDEPSSQAPKPLDVTELLTTSPSGSPTLRPVATTVGQPGSSQADSSQEPSSHPAAGEVPAGPNVPVQSVNCPTIMDQVCGADGGTYWNDCHATQSGVEVAYGGRCEEEQVPGLNFVDMQPEDEPSRRSSAVAKVGIIWMTLTCGILLATSL